MEFAGKRFHNGYSICNDLPFEARPNIFIDSNKFFSSLCYGSHMTIMEETKNRIYRGMG
jgi:hypothetical protein